MKTYFPLIEELIDVEAEGKETLLRIFDDVIAV